MTLNDLAVSEKNDTFPESVCAYTSKWINDTRVTHATIADFFKRTVENCIHSDRLVLEYILQTAYEEQRGVQYSELQSFEVAGQWLIFSRGTIRNKISLLHKKGLLRSLKPVNRCAYWTVMHSPEVYDDGKEITRDPTGLKLANNPLYRMLKDLPMDDPAMHDIHLKFHVPGVWSLLELDKRLTPHPQNKEIRFPEYFSDGYRDADIAVQHNDVVTVVVACSLYPYGTKIDGIISLVALTGNVESKLRSMVEQVRTTLGIISDCQAIPSCLKWTATMLHLGRDGKYSFSGKAFDTTLDDVLFGLYHIYIKDFGNGQRRARLEKTERPDTMLYEFLGDKLNNSHETGMHYG